MDYYQEEETIEETIITRRRTTKVVNLKKLRDFYVITYNKLLFENAQKRTIFFLEKCKRKSHE
jgi:hypothetical protein